MKKKINIILMTALIILCFSGCNNLNSNQKLKVTDIPWKVKMGINYLDDRAAMVEYTNNTEYTITEISLTFKMKENIKTEELDGFYSYLSKEYQLSQDDVNELKTILPRNHLLGQKGLELFFQGGQSVYFDFVSSEDRKSFFDTLRNSIPPTLQK